MSLAPLRVAVAIAAVGLLHSLPSSTSAARQPRTLVPPAMETVPPAAAPLAGERPIALVATSAVDTIVLFGGPGSLTGKFQTQSLQPDRQGWTSVDRTDLGLLWQRSDFNAANLGGHGAANHAMWAGKRAPQAPDFAGGDGYGNGWFAILEWRSGPLADPSVGQTVELDFVFNYETEPGYDFFEVRYQRAGQWISVLQRSGTNLVGGSFAPPGVIYHEAGAAPITYSGNDYGGPQGNEIALRMVVTSDRGGSDGDGLFPTLAGAAQVDDISVTWSDGVQPGLTSVTDFEGSGPFDWVAVEAPFVGDYAKIFSRLLDPDPCRENSTPQYTFIDDSTPPNNAPGSPIGIPTPPQYPPPHYSPWKVNDTGGLRHDGVSPIENEIWSPPIAWDQPGTADDGPGWRTFLRFEVFDHSCCFTPGYDWHLRTSTDGGGTWSAWKGGTGFVYYVPALAGYRDIVLDVTQHIQGPVTHAQIALSLLHPYAVDPPPSSAFTTPAPWFDNVSLRKVRAGAAIQSIAWNRLQDAFPHAVGLDVSTPTARDALDVSLDPARGATFDRTIVDVFPSDASIVLGASQIELIWILERNPLFEDALRQLPAGAIADAGLGPRGWPQWRGALAADPDPVGANGWAFDLPDLDFFYPGDALRYYIRVEEPGGVVSTLPAELGGFENAGDYDPVFIVRALPTITDVSGTVPPVLFVDDSRWDAALHRLALRQGGWHEGVQVDHYLARDPGTAASLIGSASNHGASAAQLAGYRVLIHAGDVFGSNFAESAALLDAWHDLPGDRTTVLFAGYPSIQFSASPGYLAARAGIGSGDSGIKDDIGNQNVPGVAPLLPAFATPFVVDMGCPGIKTNYERVTVVGGAARGHGFLQPGGQATYPGVPASVVWDRLDGQGDRLLDLTFPYPLGVIADPYAKQGSASARARLLHEVLTYAGTPGAGQPTTVPNPVRHGLYDVTCQPNPFNPATTIRFALGAPADCAVDVFDVRGNRLTTLRRGVLAAGLHVLRWNGRDAGGAPVASGVYLVRVRAAEQEQVLKIALVR